MKKNLIQFSKYIHKNFKKWLFLLALLSLLVWTGCSIIGYTIGDYFDTKYNAKKRGIHISSWQIDSIVRGDEIQLVLKNSNTLMGKFVGLRLIPLEDYYDLYNHERNLLPDSVSVPLLEDSIDLIMNNQNPAFPVSNFRCLFTGFDLKNLIIRTRNGKDSLIPLIIIEQITDQKKHMVSGFKLQELIRMNQLPCRLEIQIKKENILYNVDFSKVLQVIKLPKKSHEAATIGLIFGGIIDAGILSITAFNDFTLGPITTPPQLGKSCPLIYSYDGQEYILDSETFGGAIFKSAQHTDIDNLDNLKEYKGQYKLKLTNQQDETQYVDNFKLLVADHPLDTKLIPSFNGDLHTLRELNPPLSAIDQDGNNILDQVKAKDDKIWISNPFFRNENKKSDGRDAIIVEFKRPKNAVQVKLAFNVQNTDWAAYMQGQMLTLHGNKLNDWYALMNSSKEASAAFKQVMIREGMLLVQVWNGQNWQTQDYVWEVGPMLPKDQVVKLDLSNLIGENLRIRLESTVGFWIINSVEADYSLDEPFSTHELSAFKAKDQRGKNILDALENTDEKYYIMPNSTDWAEITFKAVPKVKNTMRSFILKCNGYYTIHTNNNGEPQKELLNQLISEPGVFGQYTIRLLNHEFTNSFQDQNVK